MKIAIITHYWKNSPGGGIKTYITNLADELIERGFDVRIIFREGMDSQNYDVSKNRILFSLKSYYLLQIKIKPDIIYSQATWYCLLGAVIYKKMNSVKIIHTFHTQPIKNFSFLEKVIFQYLINQCDCVTFVSNDLRQKVQDFSSLKIGTVKIINSGVNSQYVENDDLDSFREKYNINKDSIVLLAQGFASHKLKYDGAKILIESMYKLKEVHPTILLIITGNGNYLDDLIKFSKNKSIFDHVIFTGFVENPFVPLEICNIYTHITMGDAFPLSILEAMLKGKPIIATNVGGIPEMIDDNLNGILVEPDSETIASKINFLLSNYLIAAEMGKKARIKAETEFTWKKIADEFIKLH